ncbi:MAG: FAD-dependent oxidoreductase [Desulfarculaceae bacterium]|nr:FAD-dependent oxidoreductase [Desulfarculaceae bacterium]MCF8047041.1 FAD-dependent oxidoreductase [Desulfarculaceae bacterium]MCF8122162.1 FAD-dependent oxidoreductase [Desulfarculaceae bacterium]
MTTYRVSRKDFVVPRCSDACPAGVDVPRYIRAVRDGKFDQAVAVLRERLPLPVVCADACFAPCEDVCAYKQFGDPIAIRAIKRAAVDHGGDTWKSHKAKPAASGKKVAIVGAGPSGLTAAYYLAGQGHQVTIFDAFPKPGGMMRYGIPSYRLPEARLDRDVQDILDMGVEFKGATLVGKDIGLAQLDQDFDAVFVGSGANSSARIQLAGSDKDGVLWGWEFLRDVALDQAPAVGKKVVVVGGGNVAIDVALTAKRLGAGEVQLFCLESREEMPAHPWEISLAEAEGVVINNSWGPKEVVGQGKASGVAFRACTSVFDKGGKFSPVYNEGVTTQVESDTVILAIGQSSVLEFVDLEGVDTAGNRIQAGADQATGAAGVFAGGDVVTGPASIIGGVAQGRRAAEAIDQYLGGDGDISEVLAAPEDEVELTPLTGEILSRQEMPHLHVWERGDNFDQVEQPMSAKAVTAEASRCLQCDARTFEVVLNTEYCKECGYCAEVCAVETFGPAEAFNLKGYRPMEVKSPKWCVGCFKCFFSCPDFAIGVVEKTA